MRKLIVANLVSLDGCVDGPGGDLTIMPMGGFFDEYNHERQVAADTLLLGRTTYLLLKGYWPAVAEDPMSSAEVVANPSVAEMHQDMGRRNNTMLKVVVSDSLTERDTAPWTGTTTIVPRSEAHKVVAELKQQPGEDILTFGSPTLWNDLLTAGLVDELHLMIGAVVAGGGTPAFSAGIPPLRLLGTRRRDGSENVVLRYKVLNQTR
jgi:dihydrofolate reductase